MGDTFYPNFVSFRVDKFEHHLYLNCFNGLNPFPMIQTELNSISSDPVQDNDFLKNCFGHNYVRRHKDF